VTELLAFVCPFAISLALTAGFIRWAPRLGLIDQPNARKVHTQPTPRGGGLAIYLGMAVTAALLPAVWTWDLLLVLGLGLGIVVLGLWDDLRPLPWQFRLGVQTLAAVVVVSLWPAERSWLDRGLAVIWIVGLVNAFNMLDNMDALSAGLAGIAAAAFLVILELISLRDAALPFLMLIGAVAGFLVFNRPPARIFMGDAGSTFLGFFLGIRSLDVGIACPGSFSSWLVPLCVLAVPWYDMTTVVALRLWQGRSPFHADKQHLSHRLVQLGLTSPAAVRAIYLLGIASGLTGLAICRAAGETAGFAAAALACSWLAVAAVEYARHYRK
jgi:UDP-GlcNAc:undecaprenyl-phosphate GlcNAc-1-phosphate transferase